MPRSTLPWLFRYGRLFAEDTRLCDEALFSDEVTLAKALDGVDSNGWDRKGEFHCSTFIRARAQIAFIREEIFEIALGFNTIAPIEALMYDVLLENNYKLTIH